RGAHRTDRRHRSGHGAGPGRTVEVAPGCAGGRGRGGAGGAAAPGDGLSCSGGGRQAVIALRRPASRPSTAVPVLTATITPSTAGPPATPCSTPATSSAPAAIR